MCEGIARAGNGLCLMAETSESIVGKCSKLVRASRTYILRNVSIDWGVHTDLAEAHRTGNTQLRGVRQAPGQVAAIYPGNRFIAFGMIEDREFVLPREVIIRAQRDGAGEVLQFSVPVQVVEFPPDHPRPALIPILAARRAIMDIQDTGSPETSPDAKAVIVRLGTQYQLASKYTSFVAVDKRTRAEVESRPAPSQISQSNFSFGSTNITMDAVHGLSGPPHIGAARSAFPMGMALFGSSSSASAAPPASNASSGLFSVKMGSSSSSHPGTLFGGSTRAVYAPPAENASAGLFGSSGGSTSGFGAPVQQARQNMQRRPQVQPFAAQSAFGAVSQAPATTSSFSIPTLGRERERDRERDRESLPQTAEDKVLQLVRLQAFDGSFPPTDRLQLIIGKSNLQQAQNLGVSERIWATVLAVAFLKKYMQNQPELLDGLVEKAVEFLGGSGTDYDTLLAHAEKLVS